MSIFSRFQELHRWALPLCCLGMIAAGCSRSAERQAAIRYHAAQGDFDTVERTLNELHGSSLASDPGSKGERLRESSGLLWTFERGMVSVLRGDYSQAFNFLNEASNLVEHFRTQWTSGNIAREVAAALANDTLLNYDGNAYEHIQVEFWRSLNELLQAQRYEGILPGQPEIDRVEAEQHMTNAISFARRMVLNQIQEGDDAAGAAIGLFGRRTYYDDPFARIFSAALILALPPSQRDADDLQFALVMLQNAWNGYAKERADLAGQRHWHYEVPERSELQVLVTLMHRIGEAYDPVGWREWAANNQVPPPQPLHLGALETANAVALPEGYGSILLLNKADLAAYRETLQILAAVGTIPISYTVPRHDREVVRRFSIGGFAFVARGPGADIVNAWAAFPIPPQLSLALAPGGAAIMGTAIPVHDRDQPIGPLPLVRVSHETAGSLEAPLQVLSDIDAYARVTLKEQHPSIVTRALIRTAIKQIAANLAAREAEKRGGRLAGLATGLAGSALATASEVADLRGTLLLPNTIQAALIDVPAGVNQVRLQYGQESIDLGAVQVPEGRLVILPVRSFPNPPQAR